MTTEELIALGLTEDQAKSVFALHGKSLNETKAALTTAEQERDSYKDQNEQLTRSLDELKKDAGTSKETADKLDVLQKEFDTYKTDAEAQLAKVKKDGAIALALKDTGTLDADVLLTLIDTDKVELDEAGKPKLDEIVAGLRESKQYLFAQQPGADDGAKDKKPSFATGGNPAGDGGGEADPFQAVIDSYGKQ
jgi:hypothetical protein